MPAEMPAPYAIDALIDTHCHIDFAAFDRDREDVLRHAAEQGIDTIIVPAVSQDSWQNTIAICARYDQLQLALGLHPVYVEQHRPQHLVELEKLICVYKPIAVGEIGLDYYLKELDQDKQRAYFTEQLSIAKQHQLPAIIHNRKAHDECLRILQDMKLQGGVVHAFNGSIQQAEKYIELGFLLGFGGMLTHPRSSRLRKLVTALQLENIVLETDAPDMTVWQHRGGRNSPAYLPHVLQTVAELKHLSTAEVAATTCRNARRIFAC